MSTPQPPTRPPQVSSGSGQTNSTPLSRTKLMAWGQLMLELIIAQVAMALGNIDVLGTHPLSFLTAWGEALQQKASDAYTQSQTAQSTADDAQTTATDAKGDASNALAQIAGLPGLILSWFTGGKVPIPMGALSTAQPNLTDYGAFPPGSIAPSGDFSVDMTTNRTEGDNTGSALVLANGSPHAINTGNDRTDKIAVAQGQKISHTIYAVHAAAVMDGLGPAVITYVRPFAGDVELPLVELDRYTPTTADLPFPGMPLTGVYDVPPGVTGVQFRELLTEHALSGAWRFDDALINQAADLSAIPGLAEALQALDQQSDALLNAIASVARGIPIFGATIADVTESLENFNPGNILGPLGSSNLLGDFQSILNNLVGGLRGKPVTSDASVADVYSAASQATTNVAGADVTTSHTVSGSIPIQAWANRLDPVGCGKGGNGLTIGPVGFGADGGKWNAATWIRGTHFDNTVTAVTFTVNADGSITFAIPGHTVTCAAGANGSPDFGGTVGKGPGTYVYNGGNYVGGGNQNHAGGPGLAPGGGGAGGSFFQPGGLGAPPQGWLRQRASAVAGEVTGPDTTGPSLPTVHYHGSTSVSATISATGSVD